MKGTIIKDLKNIFGQAIYYLVLLVIFMLVTIFTKNLYFYTGAIDFFVIAVPVSALAYDEKDHWDTFALAAGITRSELAISRYLLSLLVFVPLWAISFIIVAATGLWDTENLTVLFMYGAIGLLLIDIALPFIYKVGVEKGRLGYIVMVVIVVALGGALASVIETISGNSVFYVSLILLAVAVAGLFLSMKISCRIYRNKDF